jgi:peptidyl-dipeptidase Dcp
MSLKSLIAGAGMAASLAAGSTAVADTVPPAPANPLLAPWTGPYGGVPPFDQAKVEQLKPALEAGMAEELLQVERIAANPAAPDLANTIAAMGGPGARSTGSRPSTASTARR